MGLTPQHHDNVQNDAQIWNNITIDRAQNLGTPIPIPVRKSITLFTSSFEGAADWSAYCDEARVPRSSQSQCA